MSALRLGPTAEEAEEAERLLRVSYEIVNEYAPNAPDVIRDESALLCAGYLYDRPDTARGIGFANVLRNSGAQAMLLPWREHGGGLIGQDTGGRVTERETDMSNDPLGPYRDRREITLTNADYVVPEGFAVEAREAGALTFRTLRGNADQTETLAAGETLSGPGMVPVLLQAVRNSSTIRRFTVGLL